MAQQVFRAHKRIRTASFPMAYQFGGLGDRAADMLILSPGRMIDGTNSINFDVGIRVYSGLFARLLDWNTAGYTELGQEADFTCLGDQPSAIPWLGKPLNLLLEFYRSATATGANCNVEFAIIAYNETIAHPHEEQQQRIGGKRGIPPYGV